jgi:hypothetical protein
MRKSLYTASATLLFFAGSLGITLLLAATLFVGGEVGLLALLMMRPCSGALGAYAGSSWASA